MFFPELSEEKLYASDIVKTRKYDSMIIENNDYYYDMIRFYPNHVKIQNLKGVNILSGVIKNDVSIKWIALIYSTESKEDFQDKINDLLSEASLESSSDNHETAKSLRNKANLIRLKLS